jgi:hypothetical protein
MLFDRAWAYLTYQRSARVIIEWPYDGSTGRKPDAGERSQA